MKKMISRISGASLILAGAIALTGCWSLEAAAPSITEPMVNFAQRESLSPGMLQRGREIYLTRCIECHGVRSVAQYSQPQWESILDRMAQRANLKEADARALETYIVSARAYLLDQTTAPDNTPYQSDQ